MVFRILADATVILHLGFVLFAVLGGVLVARWPRIAWVHLPAAGWGAWVEFAGWVCPLTPLASSSTTSFPSSIRPPSRASFSGDWAV
jgi:hypothetical protein